MPYKDPERKRQWERTHRQGGNRTRRRKVGSGNLPPAAVSATDTFRLSGHAQALKAKPQYRPLILQDGATAENQDKGWAKFKRVLGWCAFGVLIFLGIAAAGQNIEPGVGQQ